MEMADILKHSLKPSDTKISPSSGINKNISSLTLAMLMVISYILSKILHCFNKVVTKVSLLLSTWPLMKMKATLLVSFNGATKLKELNNFKYIEDHVAKSKKDFWICLRLGCNTCYKLLSRLQSDISKSTWPFSEQM